MRRLNRFFNALQVVALIAMGGFAAACMDRQPAAVCPTPTELKASDPGLGGFQGVDILVVVDNSVSMTEEQEMLATAFFPLVNTLIDPTTSSDYPPSDDVRIALTTTDMGVSYGGHPYTGEFKAHDACVDPTKDGLGDNGAFISEYRTTEVNILENVIPCDADASQCPTGWECEITDEASTGVCVDPDGDGKKQSCPLSPKDQHMSYIPEGYDPNLTAFTVACLADVGTEGCGYEQQLAAGAAGLRYDENFVRKNSLTAVLVVSDEEDCSIESEEWHGVDELEGTEKNIACGKNPNLLTKVEDIKAQYDKVKEKVAGNANGMLFAAIIGVPPVDACQGRGSTLGDCLDAPLENGTVGDPAVIERADNNGAKAKYYEHACVRHNDNGDPITQAYPGTRYVELAKLYGEMSYVYSICNENWSSAMVDIADMIAENLNGTCYGKRLSWDPATETADCNVVFEYQTSKSDASSAPPCPDLAEKYGNDDFAWVDEGEVNERAVKLNDEITHYWVRSCTLKKIAAPLDCAKFEGMDDADNNQFGWYYCENPGENNSIACNDGLDNDRDGEVDAADSDCNFCSGKERGTCPSNCPYKVSITDLALAEAKEAHSANVVCLQQYKFENPNCRESTINACNDGLDNDGNGPFDCHSYSKEEEEEDRIPEEHFPWARARIAEPGCCPMQRNADNGRCEFLNSLGYPTDVADAAWVDICQVDDITPDDMPDACCEASTALLCALPDEYRQSCESR